MNKDIDKDQLRQLSEALKKHPTVAAVNQQKNETVFKVQNPNQMRTNFPPLPRSEPDPLKHSERLFSMFISQLYQTCPVCEGAAIKTNIYSHQEEGCDMCEVTGQVPSVMGIELLKFIEKYLGK